MVDKCYDGGVNEIIGKITIAREKMYIDDFLTSKNFAILYLVNLVFFCN